MLLLVRTDGYEIGLVKQNICRHQARVSEEAGVDVVCMLCGFVLELRHTGELAELCVAVEHPGQLRMGGNVALNEEDTLLRVNAAGEKQGVRLQRVFAEFRRILPYRDGVQIRQRENAVIFVLQGDPVLESAEIIAQGDGAARLDRAENDLFALLFHNKSPPPKWKAVRQCCGEKCRAGALELCGKGKQSRGK